jgi:hypothetical protein
LARIGRQNCSRNTFCAAHITRHRKDKGPGTPRRLILLAQQWIKQVQCPITLP